MFNGKTHYKWSCSIAMLKYQRVSRDPFGSFCWAWCSSRDLTLKPRETQSFLSTFADWWFGTCFIFPYTSIGNNHPNWRTYFSDGLKPPTSLILLTSIHTAEIVDFPSHGILGLPRVPTSTMVPCQLRQWLLWRERAGSHSGCWVIPWDRGRPHETNGETNGPRVRPDGFFDAKLSMFDVEITSWFNWSKL